MKILAITTTHRVCGCAVSEDGSALAETLFEGYRTCLEELVGRVRETLEKASLNDRAIDAVAVDVGPGGLTGLKVGVVMAKTFAQIRGLPMAGLPSFEILAAGAPPEFERVAAVIHSSRDDFYYALLRRTPDGFMAKTPVACVKRSEIEKTSMEWDAATYVTGGGVEKLGWEAGRGAFALAPTEDCFPKPSAACRLAAAAFQDGRGRRYDEIAPLYVSLVNAEKNLTP